MTDPILSNSFALFSGGFGVGSSFVILRFLFNWVGGRVDKRETALEVASSLHAEANQKLIENLTNRLDVMNARVESVEHELAACHKRDLEKERRIAQLEGLAAGLGDARQQAQLIVSSERNKDKK